ncbi:unnamed protein product [Pedinophyceae sp. YPF-701]|nr:unnamed protein product [Pedinophyceae sp. YPF-701]
MAVVDVEERKRALAARLEALETDHAGQDVGEDSDDEEFEVSEEEDDDGTRQPKKQKGKGKRRTTRGQLDRKGARTLQALLEEQEAGGGSGPGYLDAAVGPPRYRSPRRLCSVCGQLAPYSCTRCGARFCSRRCSGVHADTRCLKFVG